MQFARYDARRRSLGSTLDHDPVLRAPFPQRLLLRGILEFEPLVERAFVLQQVLEPPIGAATREDFDDLVVAVGEFLAREPHHEPPAEIEVALVRQFGVFLAIVDVLGQFLEIVAVPGMPMHLTGFPAEENRLAAVSPADEFESRNDIAPGGRHDRSWLLSPFEPASGWLLSGEPARCPNHREARPV